MNLKSLSDDQLHSATVASARRERQETIDLLKHLSEIERRRLFSKFSCDSLHSYCVRHLEMSDPQAGRRVSAARLLYELPVIEEKVLSGSITLTSVSQANVFFRKEASAGNQIAKTEKLEVLSQLEGQSTRKVDQILLSKSDRPEIHLREMVKQKTASLTEIKLLVDDETLEELNRLKEIHSHEMPNATFAQIISKLAKIGLEKLDPELKAQRALKRKQTKLAAQKVVSLADTNARAEAAPDVEPLTRSENRALDFSAEPQVPALTPAPSRNRAENPAPESMRSRFIPAAVKHAVWMRDHGRCTFVDSRIGEFCGSRRFIEYDHVVPFAKGGDENVKNLRLRCCAHNVRHAIDTYGSQVMEIYLKPARQTFYESVGLKRS